MTLSLRARSDLIIPPNPSFRRRREKGNWRCAVSISFTPDLFPLSLSLSGFPADFRYCSSRPASRRLSSAPFCPLANNATITSQSYHGESKGVSFDCFNGNCIVGYRGIYSRQKRFPPFSSPARPRIANDICTISRAINRQSRARAESTRISTVLSTRAKFLRRNFAVKKSHHAETELVDVCLPGADVACLFMFIENISFSRRRRCIHFLETFI